MATRKMTHPKLEAHGDKLRYKKRIPRNLVDHFGGRQFEVFSTQTKDKAAARAECARWLAELETQFEQARKILNGAASEPSVRTISAEGLGAALAVEVERFKAERLAADEVALSEPPGAMERSLGLPSWGMHATAEHRIRALNIDEEGALLAARGAADELALFAKQAAKYLRAVGIHLEPDSREAHQAGIAFARANREIAETIRRRDAGQLDITPNPKPRAAALSAPSGAPYLSTVIDAFMKKQDAAAPMFKKYQAVLPMLLEVLGDSPVDAIKQRHIEDYFELILRLPPHWTHRKRQLGKSVVELAAMEWEQTMAPATFEGTYVAAIQQFLRYARRTYGDQGFPQHLTTDGIKYLGERDEGERKQRAMTPGELKRLFEGPEAVEFAKDAACASRYWLPLVGLYTGARVNELCQINPQHDILIDEASGAWCLNITEETDAAEGVTKSVKNEPSARTIPVHSALVELGFIDYVEKLKASGAELLFPEWPPLRGKASGNAEKWFRRHLQKLGLRDETPKACLTGFHTFRHTFITQAEAINEPRYDVITGHAREGESKSQRGYRARNTPIAIKQEIMERFRFDVAPPRPEH
ncbi:site-specific integrase [Niveibacterium microcysteis]|uniref:Site-specific integrase n=1 Tax=Niveibacterium microcysteis TaxID=2811415 RepID=A0ABX7MAP4_9RHOO|nr:site-specific integrase [Niveibacterium microcysteis]QSI78464.1 site-specific integrase [Niveibacterium microcysteis]